MPGTEYQPSFLGRISIRRNQVVAMEGSHEQELEDLELFQRHVAERFSDLLLCATHPPEGDADGGPQSGSTAATVPGSPVAEPLLSISWLRKLVDVLLCCEAEFKAFLIMGRDPAHMTRPPLDRLIPEIMDRSVKLLDICNAVSSGVDNVRQCQKLAEMVVNALRQAPVGDGQIKRARKALAALLTALTLEEKEGTGSHSKATERAWSFGRRGGNSHHKAGAGGVGPAGSFRSFTMVVAKNWSAAKQIQAMCSNLVAPRGGGEMTGIAMPVYIMSVVMVFTMWALVAAVPCQERGGLATHFQVPRQVTWAQGVVGLQEKIGEEWKRKEKKGTAGLMEEMQRLERLGQGLLEALGGAGEGAASASASAAGGVRYPLEEEREKEVAAAVAEMGEVCRRMEEGLMPLQLQIREVFHRVVRSRTEILDIVDHAGKVPQPAT